MTPSCLRVQISESLRPNTAITHFNMHQDTASHIDDIANRQPDDAYDDKLDDFTLKKTEHVDDDATLRAQGHEVVMDRQFNWIAALGLAFSITNSWIGYLVSRRSCVRDCTRQLTLDSELFRAEPQILRPSVLHLRAHRCVRSTMDCHGRAERTGISISRACASSTIIH